jgi:hypothetical protein
VRNSISGTCIAFLALVFPMVALAQVSISPPSQSIPAAGDSALYVVTVTNPTASTQTFVPSSTGIPANWGVESPASVTVAPGGSQNFNFVLITPLGLAPGSYPFTVILTTAGGLSYSGNGTLILTSSTTPPVFASAVSRKVHGSAGTFDLPLSAVTTNPTTEPRIGPTQTIVYTFDKAVNAATATITEGTATAGTPTFSGSDVIVGLSGVTNEQYVTVSLTNVASSDGGTGGSGSVRLGFLLGDVNQNRVVTVADLGLVNQQLAQVVTAANYLKDVNASGTLTVADKGITNANLTRALPAP